jgi:hypothetical protein
LMKKPTLERGPNESKAIAQPQAMMTKGVRQLEAAAAARRSPAVVDISVPVRSWRFSGIGDRELRRVNAFA